MTLSSSTMVRSDSTQRRLANNNNNNKKFGIMALASSLLLLLLSETAAAQDALTKKVHFMVEFVPFFPAGTPRSGCEIDEVLIIQDFVANVIHKDTGFSHKPHREKFLDEYYNQGLHPGFDVTYECPSTCVGFGTKDKKAWCELLCEDGAIEELGHEPLDKVAMDLKNRLHETSKGHDSLFSVNCLGDIAQVDLHLTVSTSPYQPKVSYNLEMMRRASETAEL